MSNNLCALTRWTSSFFTAFTPSFNSPLLKFFLCLVCVTDHVVCEASRLFLSLTAPHTSLTVHLNGAVAKLQPLATVNKLWAFWAKYSGPLITKRRSPLPNLLNIFQLLFGKCFVLHGPQNIQTSVCWESTLQKSKAMFLYFDQSVSEI